MVVTGLPLWDGPEVSPPPSAVSPSLRAGAPTGSPNGDYAPAPAVRGEDVVWAALGIMVESGWLEERDVDLVRWTADFYGGEERSRYLRRALADLRSRWRLWTREREQSAVSGQRTAE